MKIIVVDDKEEERYLSETLLKGSGYEVETAANGVEALEKLRAEGFDMIVSDILMPVMDGFQLCKECKEDEKLKDIPFVFFTAEYIEEGDENLALRLGVDKFIRKPIEADEFIKVIQGVFRDLEEAKKKPVMAGMRILVVEDNEDSRNLLVKVLRAYGHEIAAAADGAEALEQALAQPPDIIVSDILMPKMDGYQLCRECKQNEQLKNIPFVFYTATYSLDEDRKFALSLGADAFILKPSDPDTLVQMLSEVFEKAKSGALAPAEVAPLEPSVYLIEYSKRIFAKLEDKVAQLEVEITERKRAEERLEHLNRVLNTIRSVNQLIVREKERDKLLKSTCDTLIKTGGYDSSCICLFDESGMLVTHAEAGLSTDFLLVAERLKRGELTACIERTLIQSGVVITKASPSTCGDCPLVEKCGGKKVVTVRIEHGGKIYGLLKLQLSGGLSTSREEQSLLQEVTADIAFALHNIELEKEHKQAEEKIESLARFPGENPNPVLRVAKNGTVLYANKGSTLVLNIWECETGKSVPGFCRQYVNDVLNSGLSKEIEIDIGASPFSFIFIPVVDEDYVNIYGRDITEHKQAEDELRQSEKKYSSLVEQGNDGLIIIQDGLIKFVNQKMVEMTGFALEEAVGKSFVDFVAPERRELVLDRYKRRMAGEEVANRYEIEILAKDGRKIPVEINASMIEYEGKLADMAIIRDVTERKQAEAKERELQVLREVDRLRSGLLANISHELRTPLTSIKGFATTLLRSDVKWSEEEQLDYLQTIDQESDRLIRIISDLLDMSRLEAGALKLEKDNYHISEILDSVSSRLASLTEHHQLQVIVPVELPPVFVDEMHIGQVLTNLVENAVKFSSESSPITIEAQLAGDQINVSVTDRGQGIASELLDKVFDRFYQAESIVSGRKSGTGLGLSICRGIVAAHDGRIWVESKPGEGSKFSFSLPVGKGEEEVA